MAYSEIIWDDEPGGNVAGGQQQGGYDLSNLILKGPDDYTVSLEEAKLVGASDVLVRPLLHGTMMVQPEVRQATLRFLQNGYFLSAAQR